MREPTRYSLSGALSLIAHALFVLLFAISLRTNTEEPERSDELPEYEIDFIEFEAKEIEPDEAQGEVEDEQPTPEEQQPPAEEEAAPPPVELPEDPDADEAAPPPEPEPEPKPKFGERRSKIKALVPPNATWTLMLANSRIKKLPFRDSATEIMAPLRDFRLLVDDAGFNVWEDFEFIVMGSPDATDQTQAFVAVQYNFGHEEMKAGIERAVARNGMVVDWREEGDALVGDPRFADPELEAKNPDDRQMVLLPGDKVAIYLREAFIDQVITGPDASKGKTSANFVANIAKIRRYTYAEPKAGVQLVVEDIRSMVRVNGLPFEIPSRAELMWEAAREPELVIKLDFLETEHAETAERYWTEQLEADLRKAGAWDLAGGVIAATTVERNKRQLVLRHEFNEVAARIVLQAIAKEFGKAMRYSKKEALEAKQRREQSWALREEGKRLPSEVLDQGQDPDQDPNPGPDPSEADTEGTGEADEPALPEVEPSPTPDPPTPDPPAEAPSEPPAPPAAPSEDPL